MAFCELDFKCMVNRTKQSQSAKLLGGNSACFVDQTFPVDSPQFKYIRLTNGGGTKVDPEDYDRLSRYKWFKNGDYVNRHQSFKGLPSSTTLRVIMHRQVMGLAGDDVREIDHINHNGFDNRKLNLRICTRQQNQWNKKQWNKKQFCELRYIYFCKTASGKFQAFICGNNGKTIGLGTYKDPVRAAKVRDKKAIELRGEFAYLNFPLAQALKSE